MLKKRAGCSNFHIFPECIRSHGPDSCCIVGVKGKVADRVSQANLPFHALELVRSDRGIWAHEHNAASLPIGCLSSTTWIRRLQSVSIVRLVDAGNPCTWKGRTMSNSVLVRFHVAEEGISILSLSLVMRIWVSCCRPLLRWTIALTLCWKPLLMMLGECVKLDRMVESASQWICPNL